MSDINGSGQPLVYDEPYLNSTKFDSNADSPRMENAPDVIVIDNNVEEEVEVWEQRRTSSIC